MRSLLIAVIALVTIGCNNKAPVQDNRPSQIGVDYTAQTGLHFQFDNPIMQGGMVGSYYMVWPAGDIINSTGYDVSDLYISFAIYENNQYKKTISVSPVNTKNNSTVLSDGDVGHFSAPSSYALVSIPSTVTFKAYLSYYGMLKK